MAESLAINIGTVLGAAAIVLAPHVTKWWQKKSKTMFDNFNKNAAARHELKELMREVLHRFQAQRVAVFNYHNGDYSKSGFPFDYVSAVYEVTDRNTQPIIERFQKLPISMFTESLTEIIKNEARGVTVTDRNSPAEVRSQMEDYGFSTVYHFGLTQKALDGVVSVCFTAATQLSEADVEWLRHKVREMYQLQKALK